MPNTKYLASRAAPDANMLKPGKFNAKLGDVVTVGALQGAQVFSLTLEERATCPRSCLMWDACYGNNMPFAKRHDHTDPDFMPLLAQQISVLCASYRSVLIRLHVLGDFFSVDYASFWLARMSLHDNLNCFGYTAHPPSSAIGSRLREGVSLFGWQRFAIRNSGIDAHRRSALVESQHTSAESFWCPEQTGEVASCADCGACWNGEKTVRFKEH